MNGLRRAAAIKKRAETLRDQAPSSFARILEGLVISTPGAEGAALVDFEGETVDYAGILDPFELKVAAAHWMIVLSEVPEPSRIGAIRQITVRARERGYFVRTLGEHYAVVIVLRRRAAFAISDRALDEAVFGLSLEAGFPVPRVGARWYRVQVQTERRERGRRPSRLRATREWQAIEVMGTVVGLRPKEKGYRVRLSNGAEMTLVRERLGAWFVDECVE